MKGSQRSGERWFFFLLHVRCRKSFRLRWGKKADSAPFLVNRGHDTTTSQKKHIMKTLIQKTLLLLLATTFVFAVAAPQSTAAFFNANDLIWDADATQGQFILKGKYKESPENGLIDQSLEAEVKNVGAGTTVNFSVDGFYVGSATADSLGTARLTIDILGLPDDGTGRVNGNRAETGSILRAFRGPSSISAPFIPRP